MNYNSIDSHDFWNTTDHINSPKLSSPTSPNDTQSIKSEGTLVSPATKRFSFDTLLSFVGLNVSSDSDTDDNDTLSPPISRRTTIAHSLSRRPSTALNSSNDLNSIRRSSLSAGNVIPFQFYRVGLYITVSVGTSKPKSPHTLYQITIKRLKRSNAESPVSRTYMRYSEFRSLYKSLTQNFPDEMKDAPDFPSKVYFGKNSDVMVINERAKMLNNFCQFLCLHPILSESEIFQKLVEEK
ncbi:Phox homologous domain-containing protein [Globomyces pollinis-pini]|nr:Phox homologous domain-containing protein [Globomyces pollinis-pini]